MTRVDSFEEFRARIADRIAVPNLVSIEQMLRRYSGAGAHAAGNLRAQMCLTREALEAEGLSALTFSEAEEKNRHVLPLEQEMYSVWKREIYSI